MARKAQEEGGGDAVGPIAEQPQAQRGPQRERGILREEARRPQKKRRRRHGQPVKSIALEEAEGNQQPLG